MKTEKIEHNGLGKSKFSSFSVHLYYYCYYLQENNKPTKSRERERENLEAFLLGERGVCVRVSAGAQENRFYMPLLDIFFNYITKIQPYNNTTTREREILPEIKEILGKFLDQEREVV